MKVTIITVTYNSSETLQKCISSVANQSFSNIEHIIVDGASNDETLEIIKKNSSVSKFISEKDDGLYHAMNKGISISSGDKTLNWQYLTLLILLWSYSNSLINDMIIL